VVAGDAGQLNDVHDGPVGQGVHFEVAPEIFNRVEFGGIGGEEAKVDVLFVIEKRSHFPGLMCRKAVPDHHHGAVQLAAQLAQEITHQGCINAGVRVKAKAQLNLVSLRRYTQSGNGGNLPVRTSALQQNRGGSSWIPCATHQRRHQEAAFVDKHQPGIQPRGFFLMRGHCSFIQRWISSSSRSTARRWGFWGLQPREWRSRPIWSTW